MYEVLEMVLVHAWEDKEIPKEWLEGRIKMIPKDGDLFIWPAWIPHKVDRNESDRQRINLAFNINIT